MKTLILASTILTGLSVSADARDIFLLCHVDGARSWPGFNIRVDLENSAVTRYDPGNSSRTQANITPDYIEYSEGMYETRIDRNSEDWVAWSHTGSMAKGSCEKTDDPQRLEHNICCDVRPRE